MLQERLQDFQVEGLITQDDAAVPLVVANATGAPSSSAMRCSNIATVGLP